MRSQWSRVHNSGLKCRNITSSLSKVLVTLGDVCTAVSRAAEKVEEEWSPRSVDVLLRAVKDWEHFCPRMPLIKTVMRLFTAASNYSQLWLCSFMIVTSRECNFF